jgi:uncharacterized membrane protein
MQKLKSLWNNLPDGVRRVIHTFWVAFLAVFTLGITPIFAKIVQTHNFSDAKSAFVALVISAAIAGGTAARVAVANKLAGRQ